MKNIINIKNLHILQDRIEDYCDYCSRELVDKKCPNPKCISNRNQYILK